MIRTTTMHFGQELGAVCSRKASGWVAASVIAFMLCGCDVTPSGRVFNNTGEPISVHYMDRGHEATNQLGQGEVVPRMSAFGAGRSFGVIAQGCRISYRWPEMDMNFPFEPGGYEYPVKAQVERDLTIYLLPESAETVAPVNTLGAVQRGGFPLRPQWKKCP